MALPHAALGLIATRGVLGNPGRCPRRHASGRWFSAPALELAGVPPLDGMAILADRRRPRNLVSLSWRDVAFPAKLAKGVDRRFAPGSGGAPGLLPAWGSQETGRRGLGLPPDHARPRRRTRIQGCVSVLVEPGFRETMATGECGVRLGDRHRRHTLRREIGRASCRGRV